MTQPVLDFHTKTSQVTQDQIDLKNQLEMHTADLVTEPLSNDSPVLFLDTKETSDNPLLEQMEHQNFLQKIKHLRIMINLLKLHHQQKRNMKL